MGDGGGRRIRAEIFWVPCVRVCETATSALSGMIAFLGQKCVVRRWRRLLLQLLSSLDTDLLLHVQTVCLPCDVEYTLHVLPAYW